MPRQHITSRAPGQLIRSQINHCRAPNFPGSGSIASGWGIYTQGTSTGIRSVSTNKQTITLTALSGGGTRFGVFSGGASTRVLRPIKAGTKIYMGAKVDLSGLDPATKAGLYVEMYDGLGNNAFPSIEISSGDVIERTFTTPNDVLFMSVYVWVSGTTGYTGSSTAVFSEVIVTELQGAENSYPYFDGSTPNTNNIRNSWAGAANLTPSIQETYSNHIGRHVPRNIMSSLYFNGVTAGGGTKVVMTGTQIFSQEGYSVAGRFYAGMHPTSQGAIYSEGNTTSDNQLFFIGHLSGSKKMVVTVRNNANTPQLSAVASTTIIQPGSGWHDFVWVDNSGICQLYIDGVLDSTNFNYTPSGSYTFNRQSIGVIERMNPASSFLGYISGLRTYNRVLSAQDAIDFHMMNLATTGLSSHWILNEGAGAIAYDHTGNGNNGVITNGVFAKESVSNSRQSINRNLIYNGNVDFAPPINVATTTNQRYIDGTATGSTTNDVFGWALAALTGAGNAKFDTTKKNSGSHSLKLSTTAIASEVNVYSMISPAAASGVKLGIPVTPGVSYTGSVYMESLAISGSAGSGAQLDFVERTADGSYVTSNLVSAGPTTQPMQKYTITFTPAASTRYITPKLIVKGNNGAGTLIMDAWFDDIELKPTVPVARQIA